MIRKILIANRGEIARRIIGTCRERSIPTVAVFSEADAALPHVLEADEAVLLGPARASESYLDTGKLLKAARDTGATAIHPGYGFLSENAEFANACEEAGITFIGPSASSIRLMGDKAAARQRMADSGVPVLPGLDEPAASDEVLVGATEEIGFPLLIKAVAGGGGKGMRVVHEPAAFMESLSAARREAMAAFGDDRVLLERYLPDARHVEVQVFADTHGNAVHLFERDCSVQRRHQKIIEEAPAPGLSESLREEMGAAAVRAARAIDYRGAGTVEFLLDPQGRFYFMEMNTRLQVEHPVTEMITGEDLVGWQLDVAAGHPLPRDQASLALQGAAMEVRVYAEDPSQGFLPSAGPLTHAHWPRRIARVDTGFEQGNVVSDHYDPMIAKIICHGPDRDTARRRLCRALRETRLSGIKQNLGFLLRVLESEAFSEARLSTRLLEEHPELLEPRAVSTEPLLAAAAEVLSRASCGDTGDPWDTIQGWRPLGERRYSVRLGYEGTAWLVALLTSRDNEASVEIDGQPYSVLFQPGDPLHRIELDGQRLEFSAETGADSITLFVDGRPFLLDVDPSADRLAEESGADTPFLAPMSGTVVAHHVSAGDQIQAGDPVITMEAMKMEHTLRAPGPGQVVALPFAEGDTVTEGAQLAEFEAEDTDE